MCLLGMLFHIKGFKSITTTGPVLGSLEKLSSLGVLGGLGQQELKLKDEFLDKYVFCQTIREASGFRIVVEKKLLASTVTSRMRRAGQITGFEQVTKPYLLRYARAKAFNSSEEVTNALQNVMLQHADIRTIIRHYEVDVDVDVQGIVRRTALKPHLCGCLFPKRLSRSRSALLAFRGRVEVSQPVPGSSRTTEDRQRAEAKMGGSKDKAGLRYSGLFKRSWNTSRIGRWKRSVSTTSVRELRNEKQRQRNQQIRENLERYKNEQPVIDLERQLAGKLVDTKVMGALERKGFMPPQQMLMIDAILSLPGQPWKRSMSDGSKRSMLSLLSAAWKRDALPVDRLNHAGGHCRTMMNLALLPSGINPLPRMRLILPCAKRWNPCVSHLQSNGLRFVSSVWGTLASL
ncbi:hypothetical protein COH21_012683 [Aspergillus flavus]|nr:hypothetical protein COH21_012683 [Aspergillus flavus]